jgi:hypothetical protein
MQVEGISFTQGDDKWLRFRSKALNDLFWFDAVVLGYADKFPVEERTHLLPLRFAERKTGVPELDTAPYQLLMWPRETGKSSCITIGRTLQRACADPDSAHVIANESHKLATDFLKSIKQHIEGNDLLRALFPEIIPPNFNDVEWSQQRATIIRSTQRPDPTFDTVGVEGTITGQHPDHIVCDDLISREAMENARSGSWLIIEKTNRWINQLEPLLSTSAKPFPTITFIGTNWWHDDSYAYIEKAFGRGEDPQRFLLRATLSDGTRVSREAYRVGDIAVMRIAGIENSTAAFPKIWSQERMARLREKDPILFACNIMNDPVAEAVTTFSESWLRYWQLLDKDVAMFKDDEGRTKYASLKGLHKFMVVDPAFTASGEGARSAIVVVGTDMESGKHLVLEAFAVRSEPRDLVMDILNKGHIWGVARIYIEAVAQQKGFIQFVEQEARRRGRPIAIDEVKPGGRNKDVRIEGLSVYFKGGHLLVHNAQFDLLEEYRKYRPGARLVDLLDALAYAPEVWPRSHTGMSGDPKQRAAAQLASYYARRGLRR